MALQPVQIDRQPIITGSNSLTSRLLNGSAFNEEREELSNHADVRCIRRKGDAGPRTLTGMPSKLLDHVVIDAAGGDIGVHQPTAEMPGPALKTMDRGGPIPPGGKVIDIRLNKGT